MNKTALIYLCISSINMMGMESTEVSNPQATPSTVFRKTATKFPNVILSDSIDPSSMKRNNRQPKTTPSVQEVENARCNRCLDTLYCYNTCSDECALNARWCEICAFSCLPVTTFCIGCLWHNAGLPLSSDTLGLMLFGVSPVIWGGVVVGFEEHGERKTLCGRLDHLCNEITKLRHRIKVNKEIGTAPTMER